MKYFLDTEFIESGPHDPIQLISIGIVCEDGREFYAVSSEFDSDTASAWVIENVLPQIEGFPQEPLASIAEKILAFVGFDAPEFWGYYADYDWVVFCQIFGSMISLPAEFPMYCNDLKQFAMQCGNPRLPKQDSTEHHALADARWNKSAYRFLKRLTEAPAQCQ